MRIGVPKEVKTHEYRVGLVPGSVKELVLTGHEVLMESGAGLGIGCDDETYKAAGAKICPSAADVFANAEMIVKVKEPQPQECAMLREGQVLFTYLHLAADPEQAAGLKKSKAIAIAYETVTENRGGLPLLRPMSEVAGRMSIQVAARCLEKYSGGSGVLLGGVPSTERGHVVIVGGGVVGLSAARMAMGMEARVTIIDKSMARLENLDAMFGARINTVYATTSAIERAVIGADAVIGAVLVPGAAAPRLVTRDMIKQMRPGSVLVDVAIDQGGCAETSRPTTHAEPTYVVDNVVHYCVTNMPGAVARTSAFALNNATLPFVLDLANKGYKKALHDDAHLRNGLNVAFGAITHEAVARDLGESYTAVNDVL